ncbi:type II secretion system protein [candidate division KSB1 bacterium]|nr:type II secretion system protein [candidate division KSB1 bacterium]
MYLTVNPVSTKTCSLNKKAFTLIELLVVIAVIALLMAIIVPALNLAKRKAASAVCLANVKNMALAWYTYQENNDGRVVSPNTTDVDINGNHADPSQPGWVANPIRPNGTMCNGGEGPNAPVTDEDEIRGIEKGALYDYLEAPNVYHCPADNQRQSKIDYSNIFRTYSSPRGLRNLKFSRITQPGMRFCFIEEAEGRNWNMGNWDFYNMDEDGFWEWRDPVGDNHGDSGVLGFCDGHAEVYKWQVPFTLGRVRFFHENDAVMGYGFGGLNDVYSRDDLALEAPLAENDSDIAYIAKGWVRRK